MKVARFFNLSIVIFVIVLLFSMQAHAELYDRGNGLIYDSDFDITWYDYTNTSGSWSSQSSWVSLLSMNIGGNTYEDWRMPSTTQPDPGCSTHYLNGDGYGTGCTESEMGHLYIMGTGFFENLQTDKDYWSGTNYSDNTSYAWNFTFFNGYQGISSKSSGDYYGIAVHAGDIAAVPEPISSVLFVVGGAALGLGRFRRR